MEKKTKKNIHHRYSIKRPYQQAVAGGVHNTSRHKLAELDMNRRAAATVQNSYIPPSNPCGPKRSSLSAHSYRRD